MRWDNSKARFALLQGEDGLFEQENILHLNISDGPGKGSMELGPNSTAELNDDGERIGLEILNASTFIRDSVVESLQAKMLSFPKAEKTH